MSPQSQIAAVILAAGESSRFGQPKQLIQFRGKTLVRRIVDAASEAGCRPILVVVGNSKPAPPVHAPRSSRGETKQHEIELVDVISSELKKTGATIVANPNWKCGIGTSIRTGVQHLIDTTLGVPALFDRGRLPELLRLDDSAGAKSIILSNRDQVAEFPFPEGKFDIDTAEDREQFCRSKN